MFLRTFKNRAVSDSNIFISDGLITTVVQASGCRKYHVKLVLVVVGIGGGTGLCPGLQIVKFPALCSAAQRFFADGSL